MNKKALIQSVFKAMAREAPQANLLIIIIKVDFVFDLHEIFVLLGEFFEKSQKILPFDDQKGTKFVASHRVPSRVPSEEAFRSEIFIFYEFLERSRPQLSFAVFGNINIDAALEHKVNSVSLINLTLIKNGLFRIAPHLFYQGQSSREHQLAEVF
jgi:hypothetical protein